TPGHTQVEVDGTVPDDPEALRGLALTENALGAMVSDRLAERAEALLPGLRQFVEEVHVKPASRASAEVSSVMSMPTGHQTMHRPHPTQPASPNWSCQVPSLWLSHWR